MHEKYSAWVAGCLVGTGFAAGVEGLVGFTGSPAASPTLTPNIDAVASIIDNVRRRFERKGTS